MQPDDVDVAVMSALRDGGVNWISLGMQSAVPSVLAALGRRHRPDHVATAVRAVRDAGIPQLNLDVIYGAAGETLDQWSRRSAARSRLSPTHVSAYGLTVEAGTPLALQPERYPDDDLQADMYELADDVLSAAGLANYEVSNWAVPAYECRHNQLYWRQGDSPRLRQRRPLRTVPAGAGGTCAHRSATSPRSPRTSPRKPRGDARRRHQARRRAPARAAHPEGVAADAIDTDGLDDLVAVEGERVVLTCRGRLLANEVSLRVR